MTDQELYDAVVDRLKLGHEFIILTFERKTEPRGPLARVMIPPFRGYGKAIHRVRDTNRYVVEVPMRSVVDYLQMIGYEVQCPSR